MLLQTTQLSPARCHQLREGGILQLMVNLLHEHTFESHNQPEENTNIESFLFNFNRKSKQRQRLSHEIRTIIENTAKDAVELEVLNLLEAIRSYTETLYGFLTDIPNSKPEDQVIYREIDVPPILNLPEILEVWLNHRNGPSKPRESSIEPLYVQFEHYRLTGKLLHNLMCLHLGRKNEYQTFLANSRSFIQLLVATLEGLNQGVKDLNYSMYLRAIKTRAILIYQLNPWYPLRRNSYAINCGVIKCFTKLAMKIDHANNNVHLCLFWALDSLLRRSRSNATEFFWIDGSVDMLIDVLTLPQVKQECSEEALEVLKHINKFFLRKDSNTPAGRRLLAIYESRDIVAILLDNLQKMSPTDFKLFTWRLLEQLKKVLSCSKVQRRKFVKIEGAKEEIARFIDFEKAKWILKWIFKSELK